MRRVLPGVAVGILSLALAGCGTSTITMNMSFAGTSLSMVVSGSQSAIDKAKKSINDSLSAAGASGPGLTVADGDQHKGNKVCETDATDSGDKYHVIVYSDSPQITADICSSIGKSSS